MLLVFICSVSLFLSDMDGDAPLYRNSPVPKEFVTRITAKDKPLLRSRIAALREGFITNNERALEELFSGDEEDSTKGSTCLNAMATRIVTVFASLGEFPYVRYRAAKSLDATKMTTFHDLIPTKLAAGVWDCLMKYKQTIPDKLPETETCELLILDRSVDQIAPVIHEWTYDAMCHDLLNMKGNEYVHQVLSNSGGPPEKKVVLLEDHDPLWLELRHAHIAEASERLHEKMSNFVAKNKAAQIQLRSRDHGELSTRDLQHMVQALPKYTEETGKLSLHIEIAEKIKRRIGDLGLKELGQLEQNLVFGDAGMKDVIRYLTKKDDTTGFVGCTSENKLRLLMILASIYPEKFEGEKGVGLMELAKLPPMDWDAVNNLKLLGGSSDSKESPTSPFSLIFHMRKKKRAARKDRTGEEDKWQLSRFYPIIEELIEKLSRGELSKIDYPCLNEPSPTSSTTTFGSPKNQLSAAHSARSRRTPSWARTRTFHDRYSRFSSCSSELWCIIVGFILANDSVLRHASSDSEKMGQRIFVFIIGGATRSELRVCHNLTSKLKREVVLGSSSLDDPSEFIMKLKRLTAHGL
ncbi:Sec1-like protein [Trema orientale]|uniref:Sec1-like protein n=1 Tax=Trema orientale TaxID=63057 RepID=A0A2P5D1K4_TREOI|nr:Sec1-like protein [Trema orientale]